VRTKTFGPSYADLLAGFQYNNSIIRLSRATDAVNGTGWSGIVLGCYTLALV
jgi:hypothetical protein